ncbi:hypothetical protein PUN28_013629 [Cardiocondyla obscurior]|uniref:Uncharacterized protein n=1 Tax=Cardiocondyla obscurior TaxID=286306 RepID=A0AAW2F2C8_9HYME
MPVNGVVTFNSRAVGCPLINASVYYLLARAGNGRFKRIFHQNNRKVKSSSLFQWSDTRVFSRRALLSRAPSCATKLRAEAGSLEPERFPGAHNEIERSLRSRLPVSRNMRARNIAWVN